MPAKVITSVACPPDCIVNEAEAGAQRLKRDTQSAKVAAVSGSAVVAVAAATKLSIANACFVKHKAGLPTKPGLFYCAMLQSQQIASRC